MDIPRCRVLIAVVAAVFKMHEINQKHSSQQDGFLRQVDSLREGNPEVVCIGKGLFDQPAPLFGDFSQLLPAFLNLKSPWVEQGTEKLEYLMAVAVDD